MSRHGLISALHSLCCVRVESTSATLEARAVRENYRRSASADPMFNSPPLPPPASGQFLEISFRRLLKTCWEIVGGDNKGKRELTAWRGSPLFHHVSGTMMRHWGSSAVSSQWRHCPLSRCTDMMCWCPQYVEILSEQLETLKDSPTDR